ncbi:Agroclavine dehydrogenase [Leucoagaricus sp. SymC.cos]|nr:Agroclavine dehydrogenase [Leucoagaricus sp. SymC.cos]
MTILVIGGTSKLGFSVAKALQSMGQSILIASRRAKPESSSSPFKDFRIVQFDWHERSTFTKPLNYIAYHRDETDGDLTPIDRILLIVPISINMLDHVEPFIDIALEEGVERFVLVSATPARKGEPGLGKVPYSTRTHECSDVYGGCRFMHVTDGHLENFATDYRAVIRDYDCIPSVSEDGKVPFVSIDDVILPACKALLDKPSHDKERVIVGLELLTYDQAANIFSCILNRPIRHRRGTIAEHAKLYKMVGLGEIDADLLNKYDIGVARGSDETAFAEEGKIIGKKHLEEFVRSHK